MPNCRYDGLSCQSLYVCPTCCCHYHSLIHLSFGEPSFDEMSVYEMSIDELSFNKVSFHSPELLKTEHTLRLASRRSHHCYPTLSLLFPPISSSNRGGVKISEKKSFRIFILFSHISFLGRNCFMTHNVYLVALCVFEGISGLGSPRGSSET